MTEPDRVVREFKRQVGDPTPIVIDGVDHTAHDLMALLVGHVVDQVAQRQGGRPDRIALTHPASWRTHKLDLVRTALHGHAYDGSKATRELGLSYTPVEHTIRRTVDWFHDEGLVERR